MSVNIHETNHLHGLQVASASKAATKMMAELPSEIGALINLLELYQQVS